MNRVLGRVRDDQERVLRAVASAIAGCGVAGPFTIAQAQMAGK